MIYYLEVDTPNRTYRSIDQKGTPEEIENHIELVRDLLNNEESMRMEQVSADDLDVILIFPKEVLNKSVVRFVKKLNTPYDYK